MNIRDVLNQHLPVLAISQRGAPKATAEKVTEAWESMIGDLDPEAVDVAFQVWGRREDRFPTPRDIRDIATGYVPPSSPDSFWWASFTYDFGGDPSTLSAESKRKQLAYLDQLGRPSGYGMSHIHAENWDRLRMALAG